VFNVVGQQLSVAATRAILARLTALRDGRLSRPADLVATDAETLRSIGLSRAKAEYLRDLAECLSDSRLDLERLRILDDDAARAELMQVKGVGRFTADGVLLLAYADLTFGLRPTSPSGGRSSVYGILTPLRRSPTSTRSATAFAPGAHSPPSSSTDPVAERGKRLVFIELQTTAGTTACAGLIPGSRVARSRSRSQVVPSLRCPWPRARTWSRPSTKEVRDVLAQQPHGPREHPAGRPRGARLPARGGPARAAARSRL
jgi:hypothetical protein